MQEIKQELSESAIRQMSFTHYLKLSEGDSIYLKAVSGEAYVGGKSKLMFSGEYISEWVEYVEKKIYRFELRVQSNLFHSKRHSTKLYMETVWIRTVLS